MVEIGSGLNTRFERLDNGAVHWFDLDLPDVVELRRSRAPYCFVAEGVFIYLKEQEVKAALAQIAANFPGAVIAFDSANRRAMEHENKDHARRKLEAFFAWACQDPGDIENWNIGLRLVESRTVADIPDPLRPRLSLPLRAGFRIFAKLLPGVSQAYRLNLFIVQPGD